MPKPKKPVVPTPVVEVVKVEAPKFPAKRTKKPKGMVTKPPAKLPKGLKRTDIAPRDRPLLPQQARFVQEYLKDFNGGMAAKRAGYEGDDNTLRVTSSRLLMKAQIRVELDRLKAELEKQWMIDEGKLLIEYGNIAFSNIADVSDDPALKALPRSVSSAIKSYESTVTERKESEDGAPPEKVTKAVKIVMHDKLKGMDFIAKFKGMIPDGATNVNVNITPQVQVAMDLAPMEDDNVINVKALQLEDKRKAKSNVPSNDES